MIILYFSQLETWKAFLTISLPKNMEALQIFPQQWIVNLSILLYPYSQCLNGTWYLSSDNYQDLISCLSFPSSPQHSPSVQHPHFKSFNLHFQGEQEYLMHTDDKETEFEKKQSNGWGKSKEYDATRGKYWQ